MNLLMEMIVWKIRPYHQPYPEACLLYTSVMRTNFIAKKNRAIQTKLEKVISYTKQTMVAYMSEEALNRLCAYIVDCLLYTSRCV